VRHTFPQKKPKALSTTNCNTNESERLIAWDAKALTATIPTENDAPERPEKPKNS
jgi:hypothetical protein